MSDNLNCDILLHMPWFYFRAPVSTLKHLTEDGGLEFIDVATKFLQFFLKTFGPKRTGVDLMSVGRVS
jgi:hypothetical protein